MKEIAPKILTQRPLRLGRSVVVDKGAISMESAVRRSRSRQKRRWEATLRVGFTVVSVGDGKTTTAAGLLGRPFRAPTFGGNIYQWRSTRPLVDKRMT